MTYGLPYQGSKSRIAPWVLDHLPRARTLYEPFCGGCAITHCAMERGQYERFVLNDTRPTAAFFKKCAEGGMRNETRWISRDDFFKLKDTYMYVRMCFSFGNDGRTYAYSRKVEPYKKACHYAIVFDKWSELFETAPEIATACHEACNGVAGMHERRLVFKRGLLKALKALGRDRYKSSVNFHECTSVEHRIDTKTPACLESLERLERLQSLQSLESLETQRGDYRNLAMDDADGVIYCDPPYKNAKGYDAKFDHDAFHEWCLEQKLPVYISEYSMPEDRFDCIAEVGVTRKFSDSKATRCHERLYVPKGRAR